MSASFLRRRIELLEHEAPAGSLPEEITAARQYRNDPLGFVMWAFPWGQPGTPLEKEHGPDEWQQVFLQDLGALLSQREFDGINPVDPIQMAVASGHGIGKSTLIAWLHWWIMCTRPQFKRPRYCQYLHPA